MGLKKFNDLPPFLSISLSRFKMPNGAENDDVRKNSEKEKKIGSCHSIYENEYIISIHNFLIFEAN